MPKKSNNLSEAQPVDLVCIAVREDAGINKRHVRNEEKESGCQHVDEDLMRLTADVD